MRDNALYPEGHRCRARARALARPGLVAEGMEPRAAPKLSGSHGPPEHCASVRSVGRLSVKRWDRLDIQAATGRSRGFMVGASLFCLALSGAASATWNIENRVVIEHGKLVIDHTRTVKEITAAQANGGFKADMGVGLFQNRLKSALKFNDVSLPGKRIHLDTHITTAPIIYVAKELPKGSCAYQLVLGHELQHHEYDLEVLRAMPDEIRHITRQVFSIDQLERSGTLNQQRAMGHFFQQFNYVYQALGEMRHPIIDSPESYRQLSRMCNGEVGKLLGAMPR